MSEAVEDWRATIAERAAILEHDNGLSRADAEASGDRRDLEERTPVAVRPTASSVS